MSIEPCDASNVERKGIGFFKCLVIFSLTVSVVLLINHFAPIVISETDSHPKHYFIHFSYWKPAVQDYTLLHSPWYGKKIIKQVIGVEGDIIWYDDTHCLWVQDHKIGYAKLRSKDNQVLTPIQPQVIPKGFVFVYSKHPNSFDSRYQELGLIPISALEGKVLPLI